MAFRNAAAAYGQSKVVTASPAELTLMLYEGAIKFCNIAIVAIENQEIEKAHNNIKKAERIIEEFQSTLDFKYPVAEDFNKLYDYIYAKLVQANLKKDPAILEEVLVELRDLRDIWKQIMHTAKK